jgi:hypothetical protein
MAIIPLIAVLLLFGILTGANFFALGASTFLIVIQLAKHFSNRWIEAIEVARFVEAHEVTVGQSVGVGMKRSLSDTPNFLPWRSKFWYPRCNCLRFHPKKRPYTVMH